MPLALTFSVSALAQHDHHTTPGMQMPADTARNTHQRSGLPADSSHQPGMSMSMSYAYSRHLLMSRNGSGTA